jgi:hypothetical protein
MSSYNPQITKASGYNTNQIIFSDPIAGSIPNSIPQINFKRVQISTKYPDGTVGPLILSTSKVYSYGVSENKSDPGKLGSYTLPLVLHSREGPSKEEKDLTDTFYAITEACKKHIFKNREKLEKFELELSELKGMGGGIWIKKDKGKPVEGASPTLYVKLSCKKGKIDSQFYDTNGDELDPLTLIGKHCRVHAAIRIESIFIGTKFALQVKLHECEVELLETGNRRLLRPTSQPMVTTSSSSLPLNNSDINDDNENEIKDDDIVDEVPIEPEVKPKTVVRKVKKIVRRSDGDE